METPRLNKPLRLAMSKLRFRRWVFRWQATIRLCFRGNSSLRGNRIPAAIDPGSVCQPYGCGQCDSDRYRCRWWKASRTVPVQVRALNKLPILSQPSGQSALLGQAIEVPFSVTDPEGQAVVVTARSSQPAFLADSSLLVQGNGLNRTLSDRTDAAHPGPFDDHSLRRSMPRAESRGFPFCSWLATPIRRRLFRVCPVR